MLLQYFHSVHICCIEFEVKNGKRQFYSKLIRRFPSNFSAWFLLIDFIKMCQIFGPCWYFKKKNRIFIIGRIKLPRPQKKVTKSVLNLKMRDLRLFTRTFIQCCFISFHLLIENCSLFPLCQDNRFHKS